MGSTKLFQFLGKLLVKKDSSEEYEGLNMDGRVEPTNAAGVYSDLRRNSKEPTGIQIVAIISLSKWAVGCSLIENETY